MKMTALAALGISGIATFMIAAAQPAAAAPAGPDSVKDTVSRLESNGYKVILNKVGSAPLEQCTVSGVRPGCDVTEFRQNRRDQLVERILYKTVYVRRALLTHGAAGGLTIVRPPAHLKTPAASGATEAVGIVAP